MVWVKRGVLGHLTNKCQKGLGRVIKLYAKFHKDFFITSIEDGNHGYGSLHYNGNGVDFISQGIKIDAIREVLGKDFDVVDEANHIHMEYDPK